MFDAKHNVVSQRQDNHFMPVTPTVSVLWKIGNLTNVFAENVFIADQPRFISIEISNIDLKWEMEVNSLVADNRNCQNRILKNGSILYLFMNSFYWSIIILFYIEIDFKVVTEKY